MKYELIDSYKNTALSPSDVGDLHNNIRITFVDGPKVNITGDIPLEYSVDFIDLDRSVVAYSTTIKNNMWCANNTKYFTNWKVVVKVDGSIVKEEILLLENKPVKVVLDTQSIGDLIAYIGAVNQFQLKHKCKLHCVVFNEELRNIFTNTYKNLTFSGVNERDEDYYAAYKIGWFTDWHGRALKSPQVMSLANISSSILGLGFAEFKPTLKFKRATSGKKYVCIGTQSTAQFKYWNNPTGWSEVVKYLKSLGYEVWCIDKFSVFGNPDYPMNKMPEGVVDMTGDYTIEDRLSQLSGADFFIGISSGLSWLAWSAGIPVILISGIGDFWTEFFTPHRVINHSVCNSCTNDTAHVFDKGNWMYCPRKKDFECSKQIGSDVVIKEIDMLRSNFYRTMHSEFCWDGNATDERFLLYREIFSQNIYERILKIEPGDVVVDIGAHIGAFTYIAAKKRPKRLIAVEPSSIRMDVLKHNLKNHSVTYVKKGISKKEETIKDGLVFWRVVEDLETITFDTLLKQCNLTKIDFLKIDCEGGEYSVFTEKNFDWISKNIKKIAGEWHLDDGGTMEEFRNFRDNFLTRLKKYEVYSIDGVDIKWDLFNEHFLDYYEHIVIHIDNSDTFIPLNTTPVSITREDRQGNPLITDPSFYGDMFNLSGKVAVVTGAGGHLGSAMCMGLVSHGAKVYALGRDVEKIKAKLHTSDNYRKENIIPIACDVTNTQQVETVLNEIGTIDLLVNNAFNEKRKPFEELTDADWKNGMDAILTQQFVCSKAVLPKMAERGSGNIINIASIYGSIAIDQRAYQTVPSSTTFYCAAKAASIQLTKELAVQYADKGIRINSISPGHFPKPPSDPTKANPRYVQGLSDMVPMRRVGCADEVAGAAVFLASEASSYITGHNLVIDGGRTIW